MTPVHGRPGAPADRLRVLGVRHRGPGSARAVRRALEKFQPDMVLIEGPPEADPLARFIGDLELVPPVALLAYAPDAPGTATFWPFAVFSPEWQAMAWAEAADVLVRFFDLPAATVLAMRDAPTGKEPTVRQEAEVDDRSDPLALLARAAGYDDPERWWDDVMELRTDGDPFDVITEAMAELRLTEVIRRHPLGEELREQRRQAYMRKVLRNELRTGKRVAVVCGAWHAPALTGKLPPVSADNAVLRRMPKRKVAMTWVPWTHSRLAVTSGYGAGVDSPGWYQHLFTTLGARLPDSDSAASAEVVSRWLTGVAQVLRVHDLPVSAGHVVDAVRLADALAALRGRPVAGLTEVTDATLAVLCGGSPVALKLVTREAVVGERLGGVPASAPGVPLDADLRATARSLRLRLRLRFEPEPRELTLDLRRSTDLGRSRLLHRLTLLGVPWGIPREVSTIGTFKEGWDLEWSPELSVRVIEASLWGLTVEGAATARLLDDTSTLEAVTAGVATALRAGLAGAPPGLLEALDERAAADTDVAHLMDALPTLVRARRYGDVRGTDTGRLVDVTKALLARICAGLPLVSGGLGPEAARDLVERLDPVQTVLPLLDDRHAERRWFETCAQLSERADVTGLLAERLVRMLSDAGVLDAEEASARLSRALGGDAIKPGDPSTAVADQASWVEGFLSGGALLLIHDDQVLSLVDAWVRKLAEDDFVGVLPLVRRTFGDFAPAEHRTVAARARARRLEARALRADSRDTESDGPAQEFGDRDDSGVDWARAADALATVDLLLAQPPRQAAGTLP